MATHVAFAVGGFLLAKVVKKLGGRTVGGSKRHPGYVVVCWPQDVSCWTTTGSTVTFARFFKSPYPFVQVLLWRSFEVGSYLMSRQA